jgi:DNA-binding PadR family transcriptional regulator
LFISSKACGGKEILAWDECRGLAVEPFVGRGGPLSRGIFYVLSVKQPLTTRQIGKNVINIPFFKKTSYSTVNKKVRDLEKQGYLKKTQTCQRVGGLSNYYELTQRAKFKTLLDSNRKEEFFENKSEEIEQMLLAALIKAKQNKNEK